MSESPQDEREFLAGIPPGPLPSAAPIQTQPQAQAQPQHQQLQPPPTFEYATGSGSSSHLLGDQEGGMAMVPMQQAPAAPIAMAPVGPPLLYPSGAWRGYYNQYGSNHDLCEYYLSFYATEQYDLVSVTGGGSDDVGQYTIKGLCNPCTRRISFQKTYIAGTGNPRENLGHTVEYRGYGGAQAEHGFQGKWYVHTHRYRGNGMFHLWPSQAMQQYLNPQQQSQYCVLNDSHVVTAQFNTLPEALHYQDNVAGGGGAAGGAPSAPPYMEGAGYFTVYCPPTKDSPPPYSEA
eukprot:m.26945 g.26945  ORF g.26945 m.26945 type:complete len:290 (-) comp10008_c0_seq1:316-1185(-)